MTHPAVDYWVSGRGAGNITPRGKEWPEGEGFREFLSDLLIDRTVLEFGCGPGRLAGCFDPELYTGVDVCAHAIATARDAYPDRRFLRIEPDADLPEADAILAHTVMLHVPDELLDATVSRLSGASTVIISEIMDRKWRRGGNPPVFNRDPGEYESAFERVGFELAWSWGRPYPHYPDEELTMLEFRRVDP